MRITEIVAIRCEIVRLKCTKFDFGWGSAPDPVSLQRSPDPIAGFKGHTSKGKERREGVDGRGCRERKERGGEVPGSSDSPWM